MSANPRTSSHALSTTNKGWFEHSPPGFVGVVTIDYSGGDQNLAVDGRGLHINTAGTLKVDFIDGSTATLTLGVGHWPYEIKKIYQAGSNTAAGYVLL